jgi:glycosyltransferase involved in cell wall biosynthesis
MSRRNVRCHSASERERAEDVAAVRCAIDDGFFCEEQIAMPDVRYVIITPVRDEADHIGRTISAVMDQTVRPACWILVDDGSTDGTGDILDRHGSTASWMRVVHRRDRGRRANGSGVMEAFYEGYGLIGDVTWDFLVKLDGDLSFERDYFERCFAAFAKDATLGIGGGTVCRLDPGGLTVDSPADPPFHVRGATKIYRRACWEAIAPLVIAPGWDTIDEVSANCHGWTTRTFADITLIQHKATGGADGSWRNGFKNGRANYVTGYHPAFMLAKCAKRSVQPPFVLGSAALLCGYVSGYLRRIPRAPDPQVIDYLRRQQLRRLLNRPSIYA